MPKKRILNLKQFQGSSSSSGNGNSSPAGQDGGDSPTASVNERLNDLRKAESLEAAQKKRELVEQSTQQRSIPPELRGILGIPESAPPKPKPGVRAFRNRERMRPPGPAPPRSWLGFTPAWQSTFPVRSARRKGKRTVVEASNRNRPAQLLRFARLIGDEKYSEQSGLLHMSLKQLAEHWDLIDEEDYPALGEIPLRLRVRLLSYLGIYGPAIDAAALQALVQGNEAVTVLDLAGLAGHSPLTMKKLVRVFAPDKQATSKAAADKVADSWEAEDAIEAALTSAPTLSQFTSLTHLCLSHPPAAASWRDLLSLSKYVPQVTHLSLAYWPHPTLTPNLATTTVSSRYGPDINAGGSHYYSTMDQDYSEAASLLRQLSGNLLCLQWLDVEGCADWMPALATLAAATPMAIDEGQSAPDADDWSTGPAVITIFTDTWENLHYIRCAQGWFPSSIGVEALGSTANLEITKPLLKYLEQHEDLSEIDQRVDVYETEKRKARIWMERERRIVFAGRRINSIRRARSCKPVTMDFGLMQKAV